MIEAVRQTADLPDLSHLATKSDVQVVKSDLQMVKAELQADITALRSEMRGEISAVRGEIKGMRGELIWWIIGVGAISTISHLFIR